MIPGNHKIYERRRITMEMKIRIATVQDAAMFVTKMENVAGDADLKLGSRTVDAKSLIGVLQLGVGQETVLDIHSDQEGERDVHESVHCLETEAQQKKSNDHGGSFQNGRSIQQEQKMNTNRSITGSFIMQENMVPLPRLRRSCPFLSLR